MADRTLDLGQLQALLERVRGVTVACVGDLMLDRYVYGEVSRISPEAPIPVLSMTRRTAMPGGVGNVARNVAALGGVARLGAVAGQDAAGDELAALIAAEEGIEDAVERRPGVATIVKTRFVASGQQLLRLDEEVSTVMGEESGAFTGASVYLL
ncbi:MAG TPA: PfkB family carbohydrate kinase, partial [Brevundimonas sp.]|nr:PfkB family carbohydrate kinase [Brevundimonas sp.]